MRVRMIEDVKLASFRALLGSRAVFAGKFGAKCWVLGGLSRKTPLKESAIYKYLYIYIYMYTYICVSFFAKMLQVDGFNLKMLEKETL